MTLTDYEVIRELTHFEQQMDMTTDADEFEELRLQSECLLPFAMAEVVVFEQNGKFGLKTESKRDGYQPFVVEEAIYDHIELQMETIIAKKDGQPVLLYELDERVNIAIDCDELRPTNVLHHYLAYRGGKCGLYNSGQRDWTLQPLYDEICEEDGYFIMRKGQKYGYLDCQCFVEAKYDRISICRRVGFVRFYRDQQCGYINVEGAWTPNIEEAALYRVR